MQAFEGFTEQTFTFFMTIAFNNTAACMEANRPVFEAHVLQPFKALSNACASVLIQVDPRMDLRPVMGGTISRIRRDTRFSRDKSPYRDHMWLDFRRKHEDMHLAFSFDLSPRGAAYNMGVHAATPERLQQLRQYVLLHGERYKALHQELMAAQYAFIGDDYKRSMAQTDDPILRAFAHKRWFAYHKQVPLRDTMTPAFADTLRSAFLQLAPMYTYLRAQSN